MIKFMRDKEGNLYSVKDGKVTGRINSTGDGQAVKNGSSSQAKKRK